MNDDGTAQNDVAVMLCAREFNYDPAVASFTIQKQGKSDQKKRG